jgi:acyl dehydratase
MPIEDVCRLTAEANERLSIAFLVAGSRVSLTRLRQAAMAFPGDTTVVAVVCDERAHPRMQQLAGITVLTVGTLDDLSGLLVRGATS